MSAIRSVSAVMPPTSTARGPRPAAPATVAETTTPTVRISAEARAARAGGLPLFATDDATGAADEAADAAGNGEARRKLGQARAGVSGQQADEMLEGLGREQRRKHGGSIRHQAQAPRIERNVKGAPADTPTAASRGAEGSDTTAKGELQLAGMERYLKRGPVSGR